MNDLTKPAKVITNPKKLLHSKWTAVTPSNKEKHFMVVKLIAPDDLKDSLPLLKPSPIEHVVLEAVHSKRCQILPWQQLNDKTLWLQGWL